MSGRTALPPVVALVLFVLVWIAASFWLALALALIAALVVAAHWAWTRLPERFQHGPDSAELAEREKRSKELAEKRRKA